MSANAPVCITLRADGTIEGLDEARAHILASPMKRAQFGALMNECAGAVREAAPAEIVPVALPATPTPDKKRRPTSPTSTAAAVHSAIAA